MLGSQGQKEFWIHLQTHAFSLAPCLRKLKNYIPKIKWNNLSRMCLDRPSQHYVRVVHHCIIYSDQTCQLSPILCETHAITPPKLDKLSGKCLRFLPHSHQLYIYNIIWYEFIYIPFYEIFVQITSKRFGTTYYRPVTGHKQSKATTGWWVPTSHKALVLMRAPYRTRLLKCPPVVGAGFEPRSSDREFDPLTTRLTWYVIIEQEVAPLQISRNSPTLALASLTVTQLSPLTSEHRRLRDRRDFALDLVGVPEE